MKAVRMYAPRDLRVEEVDIPSYETDECLIKVMAVGVCGSDIPRVNQYGAHVSPIIVGHEFGGQIVKTGDKNLALELEEKGYDWIKQEVEAP